MAVKLEDVAKRAGVSSTTVSLALRGERASKYRIAPNTVQKVLEVAKEMGYRPNALASSLAMGQTKTIGVLVNTVHGGCYDRILAGIKEYVYPNYIPMLAVHNCDGTYERNELEAFAGRRLDGVIAAFSGDPKSLGLYRILCENYKTPVVLVNRSIPDLDLPVVRIDYEAMSYNATKALIELGHERIVYAYAFASKLMEDVELREAGYRKAMTDAGLEKNITVYPAFGIFQSNRLSDVAHQVMEKMDSLPQRPTAILTGNDWLAYEILAQCQLRGISVPNDLSVMGMENAGFSALPYVNLSSVQADLERVGTMAGDLLVRLINGEKWDGKPAVLPTEVVMRGTTAPI